MRSGSLTSIFRKSKKNNGRFTSELDFWPLLAAHVFARHIFDVYPIESEDCNEGIQSAESLAKSCSPISYYYPNSVLGEVNRILSRPLFLNTDYEVDGECSFLTPINIFRECANKSNNEMHELLKDLDAEIRLILRNKSNGCLVEIEDVGVGISQIIPVLIAIMANHRVFVQQPELHLHPKLQSQLADAFIEILYKSLVLCLVLSLNHIANISYYAYYAAFEKQIKVI